MTIHIDFEKSLRNVNCVDVPAMLMDTVEGSSHLMTKLTCHNSRPPLPSFSAPFYQMLKGSFDVTY